MSGRAWHIITCEFPPQVGGIGDYTRGIAAALANREEPVHVWCPAAEGCGPDDPGVVVHRELGAFSPADCRNVGRQLDAFPPRRLLVQWVPHGYGYKSLNVPFAVWIAWRAWQRGDELHLMIHEPYMRVAWPPAHLAASLVERVMLWLVGTAATRVWLSTPSWKRYVTPYVRRRTPVQWLPVQAPDSAPDMDSIERQWRDSDRRPLVGHFSTHSPVVTALLEPALEAVLSACDASVLLMGRDSNRFRDRFVARRPEFTARVRASGTEDISSIVASMRQCDVMLQPYPDGITARNTSMLLALKSGCAVISNGGPLTEPLWRSSGAVILADAPDASRLAVRTMDALGDDALRARTVSSALRVYQEQFDIANAVAILTEAASTLVSCGRAPSGAPRVLFFVEGFTDIRFVTGLSEIADLTLCVPARLYDESGLKARVAASGTRVRVAEIPGGRLAFQARSLAWLWQHVRKFDLILSQELLRGSLNATLVGAMRGTPVVTTMALAPVEYFRCRRARGQIGVAAAFAGEAIIRMLMTINGRLSTRCVVLGEYLNGIASRYCPRTVPGAYYGVNTSVFTPASGSERRTLREKWDLPRSQFLIFLSSRISHEKDPETVILATARARARGLDAVLINLSGGYQAFLDTARSLNLPDVDSWVIGRQAVHPMTEVADVFRAADVVAQASLAEGLGLSTLEALACGTPVVATNVGGMAVVLPGFARLTPVRDPDAMADQFLWVAANRDAARAQALEGRAMVERDWSRARAFADLARVFADVRAGSTSSLSEPAPGSVPAGG